MSLSAKSRSSLYLGLSVAIDDQEAVSEMLAHFPARDLDEPATKDHLRAETTVLDKKMTDGFAHAAGERAALEQRMTDGFAHAAGERAALERRVLEGQAALAAALSAEMRRWFLATIALMATFAGVVAALVAAASS